MLPSGFSDPYCLLMVLEEEEEKKSSSAKAKPSKYVVKGTVSHEKIYQTDIKKQTLNPIWNQTFILWVHVGGTFLINYRECFFLHLPFLSSLESLYIWRTPLSTLKCGKKSKKKSVALLVFIKLSHMFTFGSSAAGIRTKRCLSLRNWKKSKPT